LSPDGRSLVANLAEQEGLRFIRTHRAAGNGRRKIAAALTLNGFPTKTGVPWSPQAVGAILRREKMSRALLHTLPRNDTMPRKTNGQVI
jgi:hypothetical protein